MTFSNWNTTIYLSEFSSPKVDTKRAAPMAAAKMPTQVLPLFRNRLRSTICQRNPNRFQIRPQRSRIMVPPSIGELWRMASAGLNFITELTPRAVPSTAKAREIIVDITIRPGYTSLCSDGKVNISLYIEVMP